MFQPRRKLLSNRTLLREEVNQKMKKISPRTPAAQTCAFSFSGLFVFILFSLFSFFFYSWEREIRKGCRFGGECGCWEDLGGLLRGETIIRTFCVLFQLRKKIIYNICMFSVSLQLLIVQSDYSCRLNSNEILRVLWQCLWSMTKTQNYRVNLATFDCFLMPHVWGYWNLCIR